MSRSYEGMQVVLTGEPVETLHRQARKHDMDVVDVLKRAIVTLIFIEEQEIAGNNFYLDDPAKNTRQPLQFGHNDFMKWAEELRS